jgi:hypothetical protein
VLAPDDPAEQLPALILSARKHDRDGTEPAHKRDQRAACGDAGDLLDHHRERQRAPTRSSVFLRVPHRHQIALDEDLVNVPGEVVLFVDLGSAR